MLTMFGGISLWWYLVKLVLYGTQVSHLKIPDSRLRILCFLVTHLSFLSTIRYFVITLYIAQCYCIILLVGPTYVFERTCISPVLRLFPNFSISEKGSLIYVLESQSFMSSRTYRWEFYLCKIGSYIFYSFLGMSFQISVSFLCTLGCLLNHI